MTRKRSPFDTLADKLRKSLRQSTARLSHDVGKYLTRTARNLPTPLQAPIDSVLLAMLVSDLYGPADSPEKRPAALFAAQAAPLRAQIADPRLSQVEQLLDEIGRLESAVRAGEIFAIERAASLARQVEEALRSLSRDAGNITLKKARP